MWCLIEPCSHKETIFLQVSSIYVYTQHHNLEIEGILAHHHKKVFLFCHHKQICCNLQICSIFSISWNATSFSSFDLEKCSFCCCTPDFFLVNMELEGVIWSLNLSKMHLFATWASLNWRRLWRQELSMFSQPWTFWCIGCWFFLIVSDFPRFLGFSFAASSYHQGVISAAPIITQVLC